MEGGSFLKKLKDLRTNAAVPATGIPPLTTMTLMEIAHAKPSVVKYLEESLATFVKEYPNDDEYTISFTEYGPFKAIIIAALEDLPPWLARAEVWATSFGIHTEEQARQVTKITEGVVLAMIQMWREDHPDIPIQMDKFLDLNFSVPK